MLSARRHQNVCSTEHIVAVTEIIEGDLNLSITRCAQYLDLSYGTLWHIFHLDLQLHSYKVQITQELKAADHTVQRTYTLIERLNNSVWLTIFALNFLE